MIFDEIRRSVPDPRRLLNQLDFPLRAPTTPDSIEPLTEASRTGADFDTDWARRPAARYSRRVIHELIMAPMVTALARPTVLGIDRLADLEGPAVFASNHASHADTPILLRSIPKPWRHQTFVGAAADYFFESRRAGTLSALALNAVPIERNRASRRSALEAIGLIDQGWSMVIFPEGGRSPDGWAQPFRTGAAFLARRTSRPIVPVHLNGTDQILPKGGNLPRPARTTVMFGQPIWPADDDTNHTLAERVEQAVDTLADEVRTDWWQARRRMHAAQTPKLTGPQGAAWRRAWAKNKRSRPATPRRSWPNLGERR